MQAINSASLKSSVEFQQGGPLPKAEKLIELLNQLSQVQEIQDSRKAAQLTDEIRSLVKPGVYEGYVGDDLGTSFVRVNSIYRKGTGANIHSFQIELEILDCGGDSITVEKPHHMELRDFLLQVNRERKTGGQHVGPRFWPF